MSFKKKKKGVIRNNDREVTWLTTKPTSKAQLSTNCKQDLSVTPHSLQHICNLATTKSCFQISSA